MDNNIILDDKNYHFEVEDNPADVNLVTLKVFQKSRIGNIFLSNMANVHRDKLEFIAKLVKDTPVPVTPR